MPGEKEMEKNLIGRIVSGELSFHEIDKFAEDENEATVLRRKALERILKLDLSTLSGAQLDFSRIVGRNCENTIGTTSLPLGVAGPLKVEGQYARGEYYIPLSTTEGALVASVNRGCSAISHSGGAKARVLEDKITRAPVVRVSDLAHAVELVEWIRENFDLLKREFEKTTSHGRLTDVEPFVAGNNVFLRFEASSGDAMGMNMMVRGISRVMDFVEAKNPHVKHVALTGNVCTDKKSAATNWILGRGKTVVAEATIEKEVVKSKLKTSPEELAEVVYRKLFVGSARAGALGGFNAQTANVIAAMFIATGQDPAQVVESSQCITTAEVDKSGDLYASVTLPSLEIGTVGGGTRLPSQSKALEILGVAGTGSPVGSNARKLAEVMASAVLAGELSLLAALASHKLAESHEKLGR